MRCFIRKRKKPLFVCQNQRFLVNNKLYLIVKSSPFGRAGAQAPERAGPAEWILHIAIRCLFQRDVVSQRKCYLVSILALSVTYGDTSPKVRGLGREGQFIAPLKTPTCESRNIMVE